MCSLGLLLHSAAVSNWQVSTVAKSSAHRVLAPVNPRAPRAPQTHTCHRLSSIVKCRLRIQFAPHLPAADCDL